MQVVLRIWWSYALSSSLSSPPQWVEGVRPQASSWSSGAVPSGPSLVAECYSKYPNPRMIVLIAFEQPCRRRLRLRSSHLAPSLVSTCRGAAGDPCVLLIL